MNRVVKLLALGTVLSLLAALAVVPATAQDQCCQGGTIIEGNLGGDVAHTNPIEAGDTASTRVSGLIYPGFVGVDPDLAAIAPNQPGAIVKDWDVSADGTVYTFHLRDGLTWTDGTPITSADVMYTWKAIQAGAAGENSAYPDALDGTVMPSGYIYKNVPDANVLVEQFLAGETNLITDPAVARRDDIRNSNSQVYNYPGNSWDYLAFNLADPNNPQNGLDANGNLIDQGHHPLFGDVRVRQAISHAVDVSSIIQAAVFNEGTQMTSFIIPASWAYNTDLPPISFDVATANQMLTDAGWIDDDNDPTTPRVAKGAMYAPDGTPFEFTLYTNEGNTRREAIGTLIQDQLAQVGIKVDFQTIDFNTLLDIMNSETFDALILGWRNGYPDDPDATQLFTPASDVVGSGSDFASYNNPQFTALNNQAKTVAGCAPADRAPIYQQMQQIMQQDVPYVWLFAQNGMYAAGANVDGFDPRPSNLLWNVDAWSVKNP